MPKIPIIKAKDYIKFLVKYGCQHIHVKGSHHKIFNVTNNKTSVVSVHAGKDMNKGAFVDTLKQLEIDIDDFLNFIQNN